MSNPKRKSISGSGRGLGAFFDEAPTYPRPEQKEADVDLQVNKQGDIQPNNYTDLQVNQYADKQVNSENLADTQSSVENDTAIQSKQYDDKQVRQHTSLQVNKHTDIPPKLERATFYIRSDQHPELDELKLKLRKRGIKTDKSELIRVAIDFLISQDLDEVAKLLQAKH